MLVQGLGERARPEAIGLYGVVTATAMTIVALKRGASTRRSCSSPSRGRSRSSSGLSPRVGVVGGILACDRGGRPRRGARLRRLGAARADPRGVLPPARVRLQAPTWIFFRRMDFLRQRLLLRSGRVTFVFTVGLAAAGVGVGAS